MQRRVKCWHTIDNAYYSYRGVDDNRGDDVIADRSGNGDEINYNADADGDDGGGDGYCGVGRWFDRAVVVEAAAVTMPSTRSPATCGVSQPRARGNFTLDHQKSTK